MDFHVFSLALALNVHNLKKCIHGTERCYAKLSPELILSLKTIKQRQMEHK